MTMFRLLVLALCVASVRCHQSLYQKWGSQSYRDNIQRNYSNNGTGTTKWLGILDPFETWLLNYAGDDTLHTFVNQGIGSQIAQGLSSLLRADPARIDNEVANLIGTSTPKPSIAKQIVESFYKEGYAGTIVDGATNIMNTSWSSNHVTYDIVTLMAVMSDASDLSINGDGVFMTDTFARQILANLAYGSQVLLGAENAYSLRQPLVYNATADISQHNYTRFGGWNYSAGLGSINTEWGFTLNVPVGAVSFSAEASEILASNITFNLTTPGGVNLVIDNSAISGASIAGMEICGKSTGVNTHVVNPSAMGTGLWAANSLQGEDIGCGMTPDYLPAEHGTGSACDGSTRISQYRTDGLFSLIIPSVRYGSWVLEPADEIPDDCQDQLASSENKWLNPVSPPSGDSNGSIPLNSILELQYGTQNYSACVNYGTFPAKYPNGTVVFPTHPDRSHVTEVTIKYTGPNARLVPDQILNIYAKLQDCIRSCNVPGYDACFDPGLSRASSNACLQNETSIPIENENGTSNTSGDYDIIVRAATELQQQTALSVLQTAATSIIPDILGAPTAYAALTALVAAVAATIALDATKIVGRLQQSPITKTFGQRSLQIIAISIMTFLAIFAQLPIAVLCFQAFKLDGQTGYQYIPNYTTSTDAANHPYYTVTGDQVNNVFLIMQVSAVRLTYHTPLLWLFPTVLGVSALTCVVLLIIACHPIIQPIRLLTSQGPMKTVTIL